MQQQNLKILVLAKQVPDTRNVGKDAMTPEGTVNRAALPAIFNPEDLNALEAALRLKDRVAGSTVHILTMGPQRAADIIRDAMFRGADGGYLLSGREFAGSDTLATSYALSCALKKIAPDVIFAGRQAIDGDTAQVGPQIAEKLDLPQVTYVEEFHIEDNLKDITVKRQLEDGYELIGIKTPCMLTAIKELNEPRFMNMVNLYGDTKSKIKIWNAKDIEVDLNKVGLEASPTNVFRSFTPAPKAPGQVVAGDTENEQAKNLLVQLKGKHII